MKRIALTIVFITIGIAVVAQSKYQNLQQALAGQWQLAGSTGPQDVNWIEKGQRFSYTAESPQGDEIRIYDPNNQKDQLIFAAHSLTFPGTNQPFEYSSFQWSDDSKYLLFQSNFRPIWRRSGKSDYYYYSLATKSLKLVAKDAQTAELSPDGKKIGYERGGNLFVFDFASSQETQLTFDAQEHFYNGRFGWVYEEEFGLAQAWYWSPDSRYIAFWQSDERHVPEYQMTDYSGQHQNYVKIKYPKVGDENPKVKIGTIEVATGATKWMDLDIGDGYLPRIYWTAKAETLAVVHLNRRQNQLKLFFCDAISGSAQLIMEEQSDTWIDVFDFFAGINHLFFFPQDLEQFFWVSDRNGWSHVYRYNYQGKLLNQVTQGDWEVVRVEAVEPKRQMIYYTSTEDSPLERHLYSIDFKGRNKRKLTTTAGRHGIDMSPDASYYLDAYSNVTTPTQVTLHSKKGKVLKVFETNDAVKEYQKQYTYAPKELFEFTTSDGQQLQGYVIKPVDFDANKTYPLVLNIYGGPGAQSVYNSFATNGWEQYLAHQGYVIASVNNRGSGGYGSAFEKIVYKNLGQWESHDFVETAQYLARQPWIDGDNMAIRGHSYGGYMSSLTALKHADVFKVALVGAPVTDWRLYDTIYTERYMGLLSENEAGYRNTAPVSHAGNLKANMFIAHSGMDDNVHMQHTMQLVRALIDNGKDHDLRIYPPGAHGVAYNGPSYFLLYQQYVNYLQRHLKSEKRVPLLQED